MDAKVREYWRTGLASDFWDLPGVTASQVVERARALGLGDRKCMPSPGYVVADLERIRKAKGGGYSLINRRTKCKTPGCGGWVKFHYSHGVYRPLFDDETQFRWMFE